MRRARPILLGVLPGLCIFLLWWAAAHFHWYKSPMFVAPSDVWACAREMFLEGALFEAFIASVDRCLKGLMLGSIAGMLAGILLGISAIGRLMMGPALRALQQVSLFAWIPMIMVWFGLGETSKIVFIAVAAFFPMLVNTFEGIGSVPLSLMEVGRVQRFKLYQMLTKLILPAALPSIFTGLYLALIYSWMATLGAEYLMTSTKGLGSLLIDGQEEYRMDKVLLGVAVVSCIGLLLSGAAALVESKMLRWRR